MSDTQPPPTEHQPTDKVYEDSAPAATHVFASFADVLRYLRGLPGPCAPPLGAGAFDVLYASPREVVVWYAPAREGQLAREVAIPCAPLDAAWGALRDERAVAEATLCALAGGAAGGRWLLVILAQLPLAQVRADADGAYTLAWAPTPPSDSATDTALVVMDPDAPVEPQEAFIPQRADADAV